MKVFSFLEKFNGKFKSLLEYNFNSYKIKFERIKEIYETLSINRLKKKNLSQFLF